MRARPVSIALSGLLLGLAGAPSVEAAEAAPKKSEETPEKKSRSENFYTDAEIGAEYVSLQSLHLTNQLVPSTARTDDIGPVLGVGMGARLWVFSLGPRFRYGIFRDWDLWSLDLEAGLHASTGALEVEALLAGGFTQIGHLQEQAIDVRGYDVRFGLGVHYYLNDRISLGATVSGEVLGLTRPGVDLNQSTGSVEGDVLAFDGASVGFAVTGAAVVGFHL